MGSEMCIRDSDNRVLSGVESPLSVTAKLLDKNGSGTQACVENCLSFEIWRGITGVVLGQSCGL